MNTGIPQLTDQQRRAIERRNVSIALSAGAGCGKTTVLTQRFLSHLNPEHNGTDTSPRLSRLIAITFTDRAAREMRDRIRSACRALLRACPPDQVHYWLQVLYGLDTARITTIHAFCASLLRSHAAEAGLDPRFGVADAAQAAAYVRQAAVETLHRQLEQHDEDALTLVLHFGLERATDVLGSLIVQRFRTTRAVLTSLSGDVLRQEWLAEWQTRCVPEAVAALVQEPIFGETRNWLRDHGPKPGKPIFDRCQTVRTMLADVSVAQDRPVEWLTELREAATVKGAHHATHWHDPDDYPQLKELWEQLRERIDSVLNQIQFNPADLPLAAELTERTSRLAAAAWEHYEHLKHSAAVLDFDDLLILTRDLLRDHPDVADRLAQGVELLMIDEFQDTDPVQDEMVRRLIGPALTTGKLFLVGDVQQSIYRFRRADPGVFRKLQSEFLPAGQLELTRNYRSQPEILSFVNHLFQPRWQNYLKLEPATGQLTPSPTIEFLWATSELPGVTPPPKNTVETLRKREAGWIAHRISELLADPRGHVRTRNAEGQTTLRPVTPGDIVILFRTLSDAAFYEQALAELGLEYYLVGGKTFFAQQEVFDLLNLCRWLADAADEVALVGCLRSPFFNLSDDAVFALTLGQSSLSAALFAAPPDWLEPGEQERIRFAAGVLRELRTLKDRLTPSELLHTAIERTGYDAALLHEYLGSRKVANLAKLIRRATEFDDAEHFTLHDYVRDLEQAVEDQTDEALAATLPEAGNVIRLMTIHQSKGLEFPVVFVADLNRVGNHRGRATVLDEQWGALIQPPEEFGEKHEHLGLEIHRFREQNEEAEEVLRLLYVAITRAADRLILSAGLSDLTPKSPWMKLLAERFHLDTGLLKTDALLGSSMGGTADPHEIPGIFIHRQPPTGTSRRETQPRGVSLRELPAHIAATPLEELPLSYRVYAPSEDWHDLVGVSALAGDHAAAARELRWADSDDGEMSDLPLAPSHLVGTLFHLVMQHLDPRQPETWPDLLARSAEMLARDSSQTAAAREQVSALLQRLTESPLLNEFATARQLEREVDFILGWPFAASSPRVLLSGQIDVLLRNEPGWHLLDYKTGKFPASLSDAELLAPFAIQLGIYALAAERHLGQPLQSISLIVLNPKVRRINFPWDAEARAAMEANVAAAISAANATGLPGRGGP